MSTETKTVSLTSGDNEFVKGLGLTSATTLVMGSMIGSGIFIVSADIAREVDSPALLIAAWLVTGFMTITGALAYGELAAMMPQAGGQYVYLREALGPLWGFLYGWTLFLVIQTGTIAAVAWRSASSSASSFLPFLRATGFFTCAKVPPIPMGPMVLGNMDVGLNTQNLVAVLVVIFLSVLNVFGVRLGAAVQNIFTFAKTAALLGLVGLGLFVGRNAQAIAANFGVATSGTTPDWGAASGAGGCGRPDRAGGDDHDAGGGAGGVAVLGGCVEQRDVHRGRGANPQRNLPLSLAIGTGVVIFLYMLANVVYLTALPLVGDANGTTLVARGIQHALRGSRGDGGDGADLRPSGAKIMAG